MRPLNFHLLRFCPGSCPPMGWQAPALPVWVASPDPWGCLAIPTWALLLPQSAPSYWRIARFHVRKLGPWAFPEPLQHPPEHRRKQKSVMGEDHLHCSSL